MQQFGYSGIPEGVRINDLTTAGIESIKCPVCSSTGKCIQMGTPLRVERNDYHSERKLAAGNEKLQIRLVIAQQALEAEQKANAVLANEVMHGVPDVVVSEDQASPVGEPPAEVSPAPPVDNVGEDHAS
jgi:hypothetical protein